MDRRQTISRRGTVNRPLPKWRKSGEVDDDPLAGLSGIEGETQAEPEKPSEEASEGRSSSPVTPSPMEEVVTQPQPPPRRFTVRSRGLSVKDAPDPLAGLDNLEDISAETKSSSLPRSKVPPTLRVGGRRLPPPPSTSPPPDSAPAAAPTGRRLPPGVKIAIPTRTAGGGAARPPRPPSVYRPTMPKPRWQKPAGSEEKTEPPPEPPAEPGQSPPAQSDALARWREQMEKKKKEAAEKKRAATEVRRKEGEERRAKEAAERLQKEAEERLRQDAASDSSDSSDDEESESSDESLSTDSEEATPAEPELVSPVASSPTGSDPSGSGRSRGVSFTDKVQAGLSTSTSGQLRRPAVPRQRNMANRRSLGSVAGLQASRAAMAQMAQIGRLSGKRDSMASGWNRVVAMPDARQNFTVCEYEDNAYIFGGRTVQNKVMESLVMYDFESRKFSDIPGGDSHPCGRHSHGACILDGNMYVVGGISQAGDMMEDMWEFNIVGGQWRELDPQGLGPDGKVGLTLTPYNGRFYAYGGLDEEDECQDALFEFNPALCRWEELKPADDDDDYENRMVQFHSAVVVRDKLIVFGGCGSDESLLMPCFHEFSFAKKTWSPVKTENPSPQRSMHSACLNGNSLVVFGGKTRIGDEIVPTDEIVVFDFKEKKWSSWGPAQSAWSRFGHVCIIQRGSLYSFGGSDDNDVFPDLLSYPLSVEEEVAEEEKDEMGPRSEWEGIALKKHMDVLALRERLKPLTKMPSVACKKFTRKGTGRTEVASVVNSGVVLDLIMEYLDREGLSKTCQAIEDEVAIPYRPAANPRKRPVRLRTMLLLSIKDTKRIMEDVEQREEELETGDPSDENEVLVYQPIRTEDTDFVPTMDMWYDIWDEPEGNLVTTKEGSGAGRERVHVEAGSFHRLVERLTPEKDYEIAYSQTFLSTFLGFSSAEILLNKLTQRYHVPRDLFPELSEEQFENEREKPIQQRVCAVLRYWLEKYPDTWNEKVLHQVSSFVDTTVARDGNTKLVKQLRDAISQTKEHIKMSDDDRIRHLVDRAAHSDPPPEVKVPLTIFSKELTLIEVDEEEIARQMTIIDFEQYCNVLPQELLHLAWLNPHLQHKAKHMLLLLQRRSRIVSWVVETLITADGPPKQKAKIAEKFVRIAQHLRALKNFNGVSAVMAGLTHEAITTYKVFSVTDLLKTAQQAFTELRHAVKSDNNYSGYRDVIRGMPPPCIPSLEVALFDMVMTEQTFPNVVQKSLINFNKRCLLSEIINNFVAFQHAPYNLHPVYQIATLIKLLPLRSGLHLIHLAQSKQ